jgi:hypothetical protein
VLPVVPMAGLETGLDVGLGLLEVVVPLAGLETAGFWAVVVLGLEIAGVWAVVVPLVGLETPVLAGV